MRVNDTSMINHLGVYGLIQDESKKKILTIKKSRGPYKGKLDLPGGRPEGTESLIQTLSREIKEETGLTLIHANQLQTILHIQDYNLSLFRHTAIVYDCEASGDIKLYPDGQDSDGSHWLETRQVCQSICSPIIIELICCHT